MKDKLILSLFNSKESCDQAVDALKESNIEPKDISVIMKGDKVPESIKETTTSGAVTGGMIGGIAGLLIGIGVITVPVIGPLLIAGPIAATLGITGATAASTVSGAIIGALGGGLMGALTGMGLSKKEAETYENSIREGGVLIGISTNDEKELAIKEILESFHGKEIKTLNIKNPT